MKKEHIDWQMVNLAEKLKKKYKIHILSNVVDMNYQNSGWINDVEKHFHNVFKSHKINLSKPNKEAFLYVLKKIKAQPKECILIDDRKENVFAAKEIGMKAILFKDYEDLLKNFKKFGIEIF